MLSLLRKIGGFTILPFYGIMRSATWLISKCLPTRVPEYRQARDDVEFICRLKEYISRSDFIEGTTDAVAAYFALRSPEADEIQHPSSQFEPSSKLLTRHELREEASLELVGTISLSL